MNTYSPTPAPTSTPRDFATRGVPIILGIGVVALFILPNLSGTFQNDQGDNVTEHGSFGDVRHIMSLGGYKWAYLLAFLGLIAAAAAAYFLPQPNTTLPRKAIITVGSLLGLALPLSFAFALPSVADQVANAALFSTGEGSGVSFGDAISYFTFGFYIFIATCIVAAIMGTISANRYPSGQIQATAAQPTSLENGLELSPSSVASRTEATHVITTERTPFLVFPSAESDVISMLDAGTQLILMEKPIWLPRQDWIAVMDEQSKRIGYIGGFKITTWNGSAVVPIGYVRTTRPTQLIDHPSSAANIIAEMPEGQRLNVRTDEAMNHQIGQAWISVFNEDLHMTGFVEKFNTRSST